MRIIIVMMLNMTVDSKITKAGSKMIITGRQGINKLLNKYWVAISPLIVAVPLVLVAVVNSPVANISG